MPNSAAQLEANKQNALKSTGPKTSAGKAISRMNAVAHGLLSSQTILPGEDKRKLTDFGDRLRSSLSPEGELESLLADRVISCAWRLRRLGLIESDVFQEGMEYGDNAKGSGWGYSFGREKDSFANLSRYEAGIERGLYRALHELQRLQAERKGGNVPPPMVVDVEVSHNGQAA